RFHSLPVRQLSARPLGMVPQPVAELQQSNVALGARGKDRLDRLLFGIDGIARQRGERNGQSLAAPDLHGFRQRLGYLVRLDAELRPDRQVQAVETDRLDRLADFLRSVAFEELGEVDELHCFASLSLMSLPGYRTSSHRTRAMFRIHL